MTTNRNWKIYIVMVIHQHEIAFGLIDA